MNLRRGVTAALAATFVLAACSDDDNGPSNTGTQFTPQEKAALTTAFINSGLLPSTGEEAQLASLLLGGIQSYGTITIPASLRTGGASGLRLANVAGEYDATGIQYLFDISVNGQPAFTGLAAGLVAWSGLDVQAETVDDWINVSAADDQATSFPDQVSGVVPDDVSAEYYLHSTGVFYEGISGNASITQSSFNSSTTDCSMDIQGFGTLNCSYRYGNMKGAFDFVGEPVGVAGENVTFASTSYDLPAMRVTLSGNLTVPATVVAAV